MATRQPKPRNLMNLLDDRYVVVVPEMAVLMGLNKSIIVRQLHFWIEKLGRDYVGDGRLWIYNTYDQWHENFPWIEHLSSVRKHFYDLRDCFLSDEQIIRGGKTPKQSRYHFSRPPGLGENVAGIIQIESFPGQSSNSRHGQLFTLDYPSMQALLDAAPEYHAPSKAADAAFAINGLFAGLAPQGLGAQKAHPLGAQNARPTPPPGCAKSAPKAPPVLIENSKSTNTNTTAAAADAQGRAPTALTDASAAAVFSEGEKGGEDASRITGGSAVPQGGPAANPHPPANLAEPTGAELAQASRAALILIQATFEPQDANALAADLGVTPEAAAEAVAHCGRVRDAGNLHGTFRGCVIDRLKRKYPPQPPPGQAAPRPVSPERQAELDAAREREAAESARELEFLKSFSPAVLLSARAAAIAGIPNAAGRAQCEKISSADLLAGRARGFRGLVLRAAQEQFELALLRGIGAERLDEAMKAAIEAAPNDLVRANWLALTAADLLAGKGALLRDAIIKAGFRQPPPHNPRTEHGQDAHANDPVLNKETV